MFARISFDEEVQKQGVFSEFLKYALLRSGGVFSSIEIDVCENPFLAEKLRREGWEAFGACEISLEHCPSFRMKT